MKLSNSPKSRIPLTKIFTLLLTRTYLLLAMHKPKKSYKERLHCFRQAKDQMNTSSKKCLIQFSESFITRGNPNVLLIHTCSMYMLNMILIDYFTLEMILKNEPKSKRNHLILVKTLLFNFKESKVTPRTQIHL